MKKIISITVAMFIIVLSVQTYAFDDVDTSSLLNESITELQSLGVITGYNDGTFRPENEITRAEMAKIAVNLLPKVTNTGVTTLEMSVSLLYNDVNFGYWAEDAIKRMNALNIMCGYDDGTFRPDSPITYQEILKIIIAMLNYEDEALKLGEYPNGHIELAKELNITENIEFNACDYATRGNVAAIICNSLDIPHRVMSSYIVGEGAIYEIDNNVTFRSMISSVE